MEKFWTVSTGPNTSHLWDVSVHNRLKDAKEFVASLEKRRPYNIYRHTRKNGLSNEGTDTVIEEYNGQIKGKFIGTEGINKRRVRNVH